MRKVAYTFIFGGYDWLKEPLVRTPGWDYVCFTDDPSLRSDIWDVRLSPRGPADLGLDVKRFAMKHMILFHRYLPDHTVSISLGGQIQINCNLDDFLAEHLGARDDMAIARHPERDCVFEEAESCKLWGKDDSALIDMHVARYRGVGYPEHNGLYATAIIARRHDRPALRNMCELWFDELTRGSRRDQLSLNYALWQSPPLRVSELGWERHFSPAADWVSRQLNGCARDFLIHVHGRIPCPPLNGGSANARSLEDPTPDAMPFITGLAHYMYSTRDDLQLAFPDIFGTDRAAFADWFLDHGGPEHSLPERYLTPIRDSLPA